MSQIGPESVRVEIHYVGGCPNRQTTVERVREVLTELGIAGEVREVQVDPTWASVIGFLGSPTVHVNGVDIERSARMSSDYGVMFRTYRDGDQMQSAASKQM